MPPSNTLQTQVERTLASFKHPRLGTDLLASGSVTQLVVDGEGAVAFTFVLTREDPGALVREVRKAVKAVAGVTAHTNNH